MHAHTKTPAPLPTIRRMPAYLHLLRRLGREGLQSVSGTQIARELRLEPIQVRKDLAHTGIAGKPGVGFVVDDLIDAIEAFLNWDNTTDAFLVGAGNLGTALMGYEGFARHGLNIVAAFDRDEQKIGTELHGKGVMDLDKLPNLAERMHVRMGILTVPPEAAQEAADLLVLAGIEGIWNFTPVTLNVPESVVVQNEDLSSGLAVLSVLLRSKDQ
ncbi:MAG: redox-sensing transcriptional repressor Rex [Planctomycetota bacterium]